MRETNYGTNPITALSLVAMTGSTVSNVNGYKTIYIAGFLFFNFGETT